MVLRQCLALLAAAVMLMAVPTPMSRAADLQQPLPPPQPRHFLWMVAGSNGGTVFLLGTIHAGTADLYPLAPIIEDSFKKAEVPVEEVDIGKTDKADISDFIAENGAYPSRDSITNHLGETPRDSLAAYAAANHIGPDYIHLKPWVMTVLIGQIEAKRFGLDKEKGLDLHFSQEAAAAHEPVEAFETADFQRKLFSSFSDRLQDQLLFSTLAEAKHGSDMLRGILTAWKAGDDKAMETVISEEVHRYPSLQPITNKLLYERNDAITRKIEDLLKNRKTYFVAVGAGHLVGDRGTVNQLRAKNYTVKQL